MIKEDMKCIYLVSLSLFISFSIFKFDTNIISYNNIEKIIIITLSLVLIKNIFSKNSLLEKFNSPSEFSVKNKIDSQTNFNYVEDNNKSQNNIHNEIEMKYYNSLIEELLNNRVITRKEITLLNKKLELNILNIKEMIESLEELKKNIPKLKYNINNEIEDINEYNSIGDNIANNWENDYVILNTDKWKVPTHKPPVCINNKPCTICPTAEEIGKYTALKHWNNSRNVLQ